MEGRRNEGVIKMSLAAEIEDAFASLDRTGWDWKDCMPLVERVAELENPPFALTGAYQAGVLLKPIVAQRIAGLFTMEPEDAGIIAECVSQSKGDYLEIGVLYGGSAIIASMFCRGQVYGIDPFEWGPTQTHHRIYPKQEVAEANVYSWGLPEPRFFTQKHPPMPPELKNNQFDVVFIDGDHTYEGAKADWDNVRERVNNFILFHDIHNPKHGAREAYIEAMLDPEWEEVYAKKKMGVLRRVK